MKLLFFKMSQNYFSFTGPRKPPSGMFKEDTSPVSTTKRSLFTEDNSETESEGGDTSYSYAMKATTKKVKQNPVEVLEISSDSELERSMIELEAAISLDQ